MVGGDVVGHKIQNQLEAACLQLGAENCQSLTATQPRIDLAKPVETTGDGSLEEARRVEVSVRTDSTPAGAA